MTWRVLWFLVKLGIIGALAIFFANEPGRASFEWQGYAIDMPVGVFALIVFLFILLFVYGERMRQAVFRFPGRWRAQRKAIREMKGYRALTLGMVAIAAGDADESRRQTRRARDLLTDAPLTKLLQAQTARLTGNDDAAQKYFEEMREDPEIAFLGIRGLMNQALRAGDQARALELAEEARKLRPGARWVLTELLDLQMEAGQWDRAVATLDEAERTGAITAEDAAPLQVRISLHRAKRLSDDGDTAGALKAARAAMKADPNDVDSIVAAADLMRRSGQARKAEKLVTAAWKDNPVPALAKAYKSLAPDNATPLSEVKRFEALLAINPDAPEGHIALAEASLQASLWGEARTHLQKATKILGDPPPAHLCRLWASLEESEHGDLTKAHAWLMRATEADDGTQDGTGGGRELAVRPKTEETLPV